MAHLKKFIQALVFHSLYRLVQKPAGEGMVTLNIQKRWAWAPDLEPITVRLRGEGYVD